MKILFFILFGFMFILGVAQAIAERGVTAEEKSVAKAASHKIFTDLVTGMEFILVKGGCYWMGDSFEVSNSDDVEPVHKVCVQDYYIGKFVVTQGQWKTIRGNNPSSFSNCGDNCPVEHVSWDEAQEFIRIMNQRTGKTYRLPTEAEWEYAARSGGKKEKWAGTSSDAEFGDYAWYSGNSGGQTHPVGQKKPNGLGIYDMNGNVWEWVQDIYSIASYSSSSRNYPAYSKGDTLRVLRGSSWIDDPRYDLSTMHSKLRSNLFSSDRYNYLGFRLATTYSEPQGRLNKAIPIPDQSLSMPNDYAGMWRNKSRATFALRHDGKGVLFSPEVWIARLRWVPTSDGITLIIAGDLTHTRGDGRPTNLALHYDRSNDVFLLTRPSKDDEVYYRISTSEPRDYEADELQKR